MVVEEAYLVKGWGIGTGRGLAGGGGHGWRCTLVDVEDPILHGQVHR